MPDCEGSATDTIRRPCAVTSGYHPSGQSAESNHVVNLRTATTQQLEPASDRRRHILACAHPSGTANTETASTASSTTQRICTVHGQSRMSEIAKSSGSTQAVSNFSLSTLLVRIVKASGGNKSPPQCSKMTDRDEITDPDWCNPFLQAHRAYRGFVALYPTLICGGETPFAHICPPHFGAVTYFSLPCVCAASISQMGVYFVRWIAYEGRFVPVLQQTQNGPCPLLAICNVLFLRGKWLADSSLSSHNRFHRHLDAGARHAPGDV